MLRMVGVVFVLAVIQGLTEFLPVSSSGHLVILETVFGFRGSGAYSGVLFEVAVHVGTLGAVVIFYREKIARLISSFFHFVRSLIADGAKLEDDERDDINFLLLLVIGTIPAGIVGGIFKDRIESAFSNPVLASYFLILTGLFLLLSIKGKGNKRITPLFAIVIGIAQAFAIMPCISRSGWTITTALLLGVGYMEAASFSFLLSIPAILGALVLEVAGSQMDMSGSALALIVFGALVSFVTGYLALKILLRILKGAKLYRFSYYLLPIGIATLIYYSYIR